MQELVLESTGSNLMLSVPGLLLQSSLVKNGNVDGAVLQYYCSGMHTGNSCRLSLA